MPTPTRSGPLGDVNGRHKQPKAAKMQDEILIIDDSSDEGTPERAKSRKLPRAVENTPPAHGAEAVPATPAKCPGCNKGIQRFSPMARNLHVERCIEGTRTQETPESTQGQERACVICTKDLSGYSPRGRAHHVNQCTMVNYEYGRNSSISDAGLSQTKNRVKGHAQCPNCQKQIIVSDVANMQDFGSHLRKCCKNMSAQERIRILRQEKLRLDAEAQSMAEAVAREASRPVEHRDSFRTVRPQNIVIPQTPVDDGRIGAAATPDTIEGPSNEAEQERLRRASLLVQQGPATTPSASTSIRPVAKSKVQGGSSALAQAKALSASLVTHAREEARRQQERDGLCGPLRYSSTERESISQARHKAIIDAGTTDHDVDDTMGKENQGSSTLYKASTACTTPQKTMVRDGTLRSLRVWYRNALVDARAAHTKRVAEMERCYRRAVKQARIDLYQHGADTKGFEELALSYVGAPDAKEMFWESLNNIQGADAAGDLQDRVTLTGKRNNMLQADALLVRKATTGSHNGQSRAVSGSGMSASQPSSFQPLMTPTREKTMCHPRCLDNEENQRPKLDTSDIIRFGSCSSDDEDGEAASELEIIDEETTNAGRTIATNPTATLPITIDEDDGSDHGDLYSEDLYSETQGGFPDTALNQSNVSSVSSAISMDSAASGTGSNKARTIRDMDELRKEFHRFVRAHPDLYQQMLEFRDLKLEDVQRQFKAFGVRCGKVKLQRLFEEENIVHHQASVEARHGNRE
eukprot:Clim_evm22s167 gene=Clim_evmTU22s167